MSDDLLIAVPSYYKKFRCIAGKCRHSCCMGWEIDIDPASLKRFEALGIGNISYDEEPHFILRDGDICPFLREDGLCQMIIDHGEGVLCNICADHPRFRNYWTGVCETGLGLSCEEACRIILSEKEPLKLVILGEGDEDGRLTWEYPGDIPADPSRWTELTGQKPDDDELWLLDVREKMLKEAAELEDPVQARLAEYLIFRHLADALYDGRLEGRIGFIKRSLEEISALWDESPDKSFAAKCGIARSWSERVEYNEELKDSIINSLTPDDADL